MHMMYFTEQPMSAYDAKAGLDYGATALTFSNSHYNPVEGSRLYNEYLEEYILAERLDIFGDDFRLAAGPGRDVTANHKFELFGVKWPGQDFPRAQSKRFFSLGGVVRIAK